MTKLKNLTRKQLRASIAILVAVCMVVPSLLLGIHVLGASNTIDGSENDPLNVSYTKPNGFDVRGLETSKKVLSYDEENNSYRLQLKAWATSNSLEIPDTDIMLVLDLSNRMKTNLYYRDKRNLMNDTDFGHASLSSLNNQKLYDADNSANTERSIFSQSDGTYGNNKYVIDPTNPMNKVYLAQTFKKIDTATEKQGWNIIEGDYTYYDWTRQYRFIYSFTDSNGDIWQTALDASNLNTNPISMGSSQSPDELPGGIGEIIANMASKFISNLGNIGSLKFYKVTNPNDDPDSWVLDRTKFVERDTIYYRTQQTILGITYDRDESSTNQTLYGYTQTDKEVGDGKQQLYIKDDTGEFREVTIAPNTNNAGKVVSYTYTVHNANIIKDDGTVIRKDLTTVIGNSVYGEQNGVFQGYKKYNYVNNIPYIDHDNSLESKKLYIVDGNGEYVTRLQQLKESTEELLIMAHQSAYKNKVESADGIHYSKVRVGVAVYGSDGKDSLIGGTPYTRTTYTLDDVDMTDDIAVTDMIDDIYTYQYHSSSNEAYINGGLTCAYDQLKAKPDTDRKICIVFSSGMPSRNGFGWAIGGSSNLEEWGATYDKDKYCNPEANNAIETSYKIKNEVGATVYTVGLFNYANADQLWGNKFYYAGGNDGVIWPSKDMNGEVGNSWGGSRLGLVASTAEKLNDVDAAATNRFMNYLSSNFMDADNTGIYSSSWLNPGLTYFREAQYLLATRGSGYQVYKNHARGSNDHYFAIDINNTDGDALSSQMQSAFRTIGERAQSPEASLSPDAELIDSITDYFTLDKTSLRAYVADQAGNEVTNEGYSIDTTLSNNDHNIKVTGFNYTGETEYFGNPTNNGRQLVLEFVIKPKDGFLGGNAVPTNIASSGVFDQKHRLEELFDVPAVDVKLSGEIATVNQAIYSGDYINLADFLDTKDLDGTNNEFVDVVYTITGPNNNVLTYTVKAGESQGTLSRTDETSADADLNHPTLYETTTYTVTSAVTPSSENVGLGTRSNTVNGTKNAYAYVYTPSLTEKDDTVLVNTSLNLAPNGTGNYSEPYITFEWKTPTRIEGDTVGIPDVSGTPPVLTLTVSDITAGRTNPNSFTVTTNETSKLQNIAESTDYRITQVQVPAKTKEFTYLKEGSNNTVEEKTTTVSVAAHNLTGNEVSFLNTNHQGLADAEAYDDTTGRFTIRTRRPTYSLNLTKIFSGSYAVAEDVTFAIKNVTDDTSAGTIEISVDDFDRLTAEGSLANLEYGKTYELTESHANDSKYNASFVSEFKWSENDTVQTENVGDINQEDGEKFTFVVNKSLTNDSGILYLTVTNAFDESQAPAVTGINEDKNSSNMVLIALAGAAVISGGAGVAYVYRRKGSATE